MREATVFELEVDGLAAVARRSARHVSPHPEVVEPAVWFALQQLQREVAEVGDEPAARRRWVRAVARSHAAHLVERFREEVA